MKYIHRFRVAAPLHAVAEFHRRAASMVQITPPPIVVQVHEAPELLQSGDHMEFTLWMLALPVRWRARIEDVGPTGFVDRQISGPYRYWLHRHIFVPVSETETEIIDEIEAGLGTGLWRGLLTFGMWVNLPVLFAYRAWRTKRILEASVDARHTTTAGAR